MTRQKFAGITLIGFGLTISVIGALLMFSALNAERVNRWLTDWAEVGEQPSPTDFAMAEAAAIRAIRFYPGPSGAHWDRLGRVYDWQHWRSPLNKGPMESALPSAPEILNEALGIYGSTNRGATRLRAIAAYQQAVDLRPLWPYGITRLAAARLRAGGNDQDLAQLLKNAYQLGPWRPMVNRRITEIGLRGWAGLDQQARDIVLENARRTVSLSRADERWVRELGEQTDLDRLLKLMVLP